MTLNHVPLNSSSLLLHCSLPVCFFVMMKHSAHEDNSLHRASQKEEYQIARIAGRSEEIDPAGLQIDIYRNEIGELMIRIDDPIRSE